MNYLVLVRHGESRWNAMNKFTGWVDVPLSEYGTDQCRLCGTELKGIELDVAFVSALKRAQETLLIILAKQNKTGIFLHNESDKFSIASNKLDDSEIAIYTSIKLNERYYGALQGLDKDQARRKYGEKQVLSWRRSYDVQPPEGESLKDVCQRVLPYFKQDIMNEVRAGKNVIVSAHGNSLRGIMKYLEDISDRQIANLDIPNGRPIVYQFKQGKLQRVKGDLSFERTVYWEKPLREQRI